MPIDQISQPVDLRTTALQGGGQFGVVRFRRERGPWVLRAALQLERSTRGPSSFTSGPIPSWSIVTREGSESTVYEREWTVGATVVRDWSQQFSSNTLDVSVRVAPMLPVPDPERCTALVWAEPGIVSSYRQWGALYVKDSVAAAFLSIFGGEDLSIPRQAQAIEIARPDAIDLGAGLVPWAAIPAFLVQLGPDGAEVLRNPLVVGRRSQRLPLHYRARWAFIETPAAVAGFGFPCSWVLHG